MSGTLPYKCYLVSSNGEKEIRRFTVESDVVGNFTYLKEKIRSIYPQLLRENYGLMYTDEEGDNVTISSDDELVAALMYAKRKDEEPFRVFIQTSSSPKHVNPTTTSSAQNGNCQGNVHMGVTCDGCQGVVRGFRYKCFQCPDFDLCGKCESAGTHPGHTLIRVTGPMPPSFHAMKNLLVGGPEVPHWRRRHHGRNPCHQQSPNAGWNAWCPSGINVEIDAPEASQASSEESGAAKGKPQCLYKAHMEQAKEFANAFQTNGPEYLQGIGSTIAAVFESLGLGHVESMRSSSSTTQPEEKKEEKKPAEEPKKEVIIPVVVEKEEVQVPKSDSESHPYMAMHDALAAARAAEVAVASATAAAAVAQAGEQAASAPSKSPSPLPSGECGDWTVIENAEKKQASQAAAAEPQLGARPKSPQQKPEIKAPLHPDPAVAAALETMLAMGFTNEGGWLSQLLEVKGGDIGKALDVLHAQLSFSSALDQL